MSHELVPPSPPPPVHDNHGLSLPLPLPLPTSTFPRFTRLSPHRRPLSAISTCSTILDRPTSSSLPIHITNPKTPPDDYERRLKLVNENRAILIASNASLSPPSLIHFNPIPPSPTSLPPTPLPTPPPSDHLTLHFWLTSTGDPVPFRLILAFKPNSKVDEIKHSIRVHWPTEWNKEELVPKRSNQIRLLFLGRFLDDWETLDSLRLAKGSPTIMHLLLKPAHSDPHSLKDGRHGHLGCCPFDTGRSFCCIIC